MLPCTIGQAARHGPIFVGSMRQTGARILESGLCIGVLNKFKTWLVVIFPYQMPHTLFLHQKTCSEYAY